MIVRTIACDVEASSRVRFDESQRRWAGLARIAGFLGQYGGWMSPPNDGVEPRDETTPPPDGRDATALIVALWASTDAFHDFMMSHHDRLFEHAGQQGTYARSETGLGVEHLPLDGRHEGIADGFADARAMRMEFRTARAGAEEELDRFVFRRISRRLSEEPEFVSGTHVHRIERPDRRIEITLWTAPAAAVAYDPEIPADFVESRTTRIAHLVEGWHVPPQKP